MRINIFEGARRITRLLMLITVVVYIGSIVVALVNARVQVTYLVTLPHLAPAAVSRCEQDDPTETRWSVPTKTAGEVSVLFCFARLDFGGRRLVAYKSDESTRQAWGDEPYSSEVRDYMQHTASSFTIPIADEKRIKEMWWPERFTQMKRAVVDGVVPAALVLIFVWAFSWAIGWIVRGFVGIPRGQDFRSSAEQTSTNTAPSEDRI